MDKIEEISLVQFQERKYDHRGDHIFFVYSNGCASSIGRIGGEQELHLNWNCISETNIIHEVKKYFHESMVKSLLKALHSSVIMALGRNKTGDSQGVVEILF